MCHQYLLSAELCLHLRPGSLYRCPCTTCQRQAPSQSLTYLLLNLAPDGAQGLLENFVPGFQAHASLQVKDSLVEAAQLLQGLAPPIKSFDVPTILFNG